jgi:uncharacterized protein
MRVRTPDIQPEAGPLIWSKLPEFALTYNGYSVVIPYVEHYLNSVINTVRKDHCAGNAVLAHELEIFIKQETAHASYHARFNKRLFDLGIEGLRPLTDRMVAELKVQHARRSLAFNVGYCVGFESIATFACRYLYEHCDEFFQGVDPHGANLLLWHVAEEFEHRSVCHNAFRHISGSYFIRIGALLYAFWHVWGAFKRAGDLVLEHYHRELPAEARKASQRRYAAVFRRQMLYLVPRMLRILVPYYDPAKLPASPRIQAALQTYQSDDFSSERLGVDWARAA